MQPQLLLFDLDGTLVDSLVDIAGALNHALARAGGAPVELDVVRTLVGEGVVRLAEKALDLQRPRLAADAVTLADAVRVYYRAHPCVGSRLYPGIEELLTTLRARPDVRLGVLTNKPGDIARALIAALGVTGRFDEIIGDGDGFPKKPDPAAIHALAARFGVTLPRVLMIGDGIPDMEIARAAGCASAAALWGYTAASDLLERHPTYVLNQPAELAARV